MEKIKIINRSSNPLPEYATPQSAGLDLRADIATSQTIAPLERAMIPTGLYTEIPEGYEIQVRPRSGLAAKHGVTVLNSPGTIDADYRGEIKVILVNLSDEPFTLMPGERIAQAVFARCHQFQWEEADILNDSQRGSGGFGSTGNQ